MKPVLVLLIVSCIAEARCLGVGISCLDVAVSSMRIFSVGYLFNRHIQSVVRATGIPDGFIARGGTTLASLTIYILHIYISPFLFISLHA